MSNVIAYICIGALAFCACCLGATVLIAGIKMAGDKDE
jgi:hypothetical protein